MQYLFTHTCTAGAVKGGCGVGVPGVEFTERSNQFLLSNALKRAELYCKVLPSFPLSICNGKLGPGNEATYTPI